ncbi:MULTISPECIES: nucleotidyltransferase domain-containing protein [unclassified Micromonospora]|jgi:predicted nucleotidyltransferase|uniref:nucleotidyltransferase domain-containing protein n=1 Tax=unclassified Micromonospora TaxID=2617518 RepID=UPI0033BB8BC2
MTRPSAPVLTTLVDVIVSHCDPDEIILFGSWAKGTTHRHSDIDILVIGPFTTSSWIRDRELNEALRAFPITIDLHMLTPREMEIGSAKPHTYLHTLLETSQRVYLRGGDGGA